MCQNLPKKFTRANDSNLSHQAKANLMKDASAFGNPFKHGIPY